MLELSHCRFLSLCLLVLIINFSIFLRGFFPLPAAVPGYSKPDDFLSEPVGAPEKFHPPFNRMVFILVDALRADFVLPSYEKDQWPKMNFVSNMIITNGAKAFLTRAHPPTVTMPRIKALTSGGIPGFVDVVLNFDSDDLREDNVISQLKRAGKIINFFGDDTWIKLFPDHFNRVDGTTSFFVSDYTEVDFNVTRHLDEEMSAPDWDILILHYLGLDHIGHLAGPRSPLILPKLNEMDAVVEKVFTDLKRKDAVDGRQSLLVLCGDHGMSEQGSHGGATASETATPAVFMSHNVPLWPAEDMVAEIYQIDVAPTLSVLLGLPIPQNSLGCLVPSVLEPLLPLRHTLSSAYLNAQQIIKILQENVDDIDRDVGYLQYKRASEVHNTWLEHHHAENSTNPDLGQRVINLYTEAIRLMRGRVSASQTTYDMHAMILAVVAVWMVLLCLLYGYPLSKFNTITIDTPSILLVLLCTMGFSMVQVALCTSPMGSAFLCSTQITPLICTAVLFTSIGFCCSATCMSLISKRKSSPSKVQMPSLQVRTLLGWFLRLGILIHTLSLLSSSFVEEEHQTWYFLTTSAFVIATGKLMLTVVNTRPTKTLTRKSLKSNVVESIKGDSEIHCYEIPPQEVNDTSDRMAWTRLGSGLSAIGASIVLLILCRTARAWNRTGDKWAHLPDVGDWLVRPENITCLSMLSVTALVVTYLVLERKVEDWLSRLMLVWGLVCVYCYRAACGALSLPIIAPHLSPKGILEARLIYIIITVYMLRTMTGFFTTLKQSHHHHSDTESENDRCVVWDAFRGLWRGMYIAWFLLMFLLARTHNITLVAFLILQQHCVAVLLKSSTGISTTDTCWIHLWIGQAAFYYQGNSNSIATVDVAAGYTGLDNYSPSIIGLLMCLATYAGPISCWLSLMLHLVETRAHSCKRYKAAVLDACYIYSTSRALPLAVYTILVMAQRYHLFVWTVFSPKLLYEGIHTVVVTALVMASLAIVNIGTLKQ